MPNHTEWETHVCLKHSLSRNDARNGLLILEEAEVVLQIPQPSWLDELITMIKEQTSRALKDTSEIVKSKDEENEGEADADEKLQSSNSKWWAFC